MSSATSVNLTTSGWINCSDRARLEIAGPDRAKFLHNLTTNDVKRLPVGQGQESFVTTLQGKTLAYVTILASESAILLRTETASLEGLAPHLAKYGVFDDVTIDDVSIGTFEIHLFGPEAEAWLEAGGSALPPDGLLRHVKGEPFQIIRESLTGQPGFTLIGGIELADSFKASLEAVQIDAGIFDALRIEAGTPVSGRDVTLANLPQEIGRDARTINFVKGCYLGQETVARLDALGHVNRLLKGLTMEGLTTIPPDGTPVTFEGKTVGTMTSAAFSKNWGCPVALGYIKVAQAIAGTRLSLTIQGSPFEAIVRDLPMIRE
jgi:folate-binding protein YgfZ